MPVTQLVARVDHSATRIQRGEYSVDSQGCRRVGFRPICGEVIAGSNSSSRLVSVPDHGGPRNHWITPRHARRDGFAKLHRVPRASCNLFKFPSPVKSRGRGTAPVRYGPGRPRLGMDSDESKSVRSPVSNSRSRKLLERTPPDISRAAPASARCRRTGSSLSPVPPGRSTVS